MVINGVTWATRNVDMPGTFAATGNDARMFYQWNRPTARSSANPMKAYNADGEIADATWWNWSIDNGTSRLLENDPGPAGWRVPTVAELRSLLNTAKVRNEWVAATETTPAGRKFTDIATGNSIFFPAAGSRHPDSGSLTQNGSSGYYWSASPGNEVGYKTILRLNTNDVRVLNNLIPRYGFTVRSVKVSE